MYNQYQICENAEVKFVTPSDKSFFFGYYNYSPLSKDNSKLLAHKAVFEGRMPEPDDYVEIGFFDMATGIWNPVTTSNAFNWQQGSMLQWLGPDFNSSIIFNDCKENQFIARIINLYTGEEKVIPYPVYGVDPNGKFAITLNFERCYWTRAYSYANIKNEYWNQRMPEEDGILNINLLTGETTRIISIKEILDFSKIQDDGVTSHWFEHIWLNPSGNRFAFFYRFGSNENFGGKVFTADIDGRNLWKHPIIDGTELSHLGWKDDEHYVLFTRPIKKVLHHWVNAEKKGGIRRNLIHFYRQIAKPFIPSRLLTTAMSSNQYYALAKDQSGIIGKLDNITLFQDGHPSFTKNGSYMLTDTYQDSENYRHLLLYNIMENKVIRLGKFYSFLNNSGWRTDLHPRFSFDDKYIIIDSSHTGYHQMIVISFEH
jgi:hypothetical protein